MQGLSRKTISSAVQNFDKQEAKGKELGRERNLFMEKEEEKKLGEWEKEKDRRLPPCTFAAEWAKHARFYREDEPCDDGRAGQACGSRKGE
jgi:hypothetical protein